MLYITAILLGIVEGITEFLPISSTGHMILLENWLKLGDDQSFADAFMVIIQLPAILAVVIYFWKQIFPLRKEGIAWDIVQLWFRILAAFLPAAVLGFLFDDLIDEYLFKPGVVAAMLLAGGWALLWIERRRFPVRFDRVGAIGYGAAVAVGFIQCLAMIPGTSRSAATIIGAMLLGASRAAAAEFSFFLALPTMAGATGLKVLKHGLHFTGEQWALLGLGSVVSFLVAYAVIAAFMQYIRQRDFTPFAWYRIVLGIAVIFWMMS